MAVRFGSILHLNNSGSEATLDANNLKGTTLQIGGFTSASLAQIGEGIVTAPGKRRLGTIVATTGSSDGTEPVRYYPYIQTGSGDTNLSGSEWTTLSNWKELAFNDTGSSVSFNHITASGNISASGDITANSFHLIDNNKINLGDSNDLSLYHNGNHSIIEDSGTGNLILLTNLLQVKNAANNQTMIQANQGGAVKLLHNNSKVFETFASGIGVTGNITASGHITASGNISASGDVKGSTLTGTLSTAAQGNITSLGTLSTLTVDDITINGSKISDSENFTLDVGGDIALDSAGKDITMTDGAGTAEFTFNLEDAPELDVDGDFTIDGSGLIKLDSATDNIDLIGNVTASGNISSSGIITDKLNVNPKNPTSPNMDFGAWNIGYGSTGTEFTGSLPSAGNGYGEIVHFGDGATLAGRIYCLKSDFTWELAGANGPVSSSLLAVAMGTHASASGMLLRGVVYSNAHDSLVRGQKVYNEAGGRVANVAGSDAGDVVRVLGYCVGQSAHIYFNPDNTWVEHS